jgi:hypothetical protein
MQQPSSRRGSSMISLLVLMPVILLIALACGLLGIALKLEADLLANCRIAQADQQHQASRAADKLLRLNPRAYRLAQQRLRALALMSNPKTLSAGASLLARTEAGQRKLALLQQSLIQAGRLASQVAPDLAHQKMLQALPRSTSLPIHTRLAQWRPGEFAVEPRGPASSAPIYELAQDFEVRQRSEVQIEVQLPTLNLELPGGLKLDLPPLKLGCSMTAERPSSQQRKSSTSTPLTFDRGGHKWIIRPAEAKRSSNSSLFSRSSPFASL